jgi:hypothetical protein
LGEREYIIHSRIKMKNGKAADWKTGRRVD